MNPGFGGVVVPGFRPRVWWIGVAVRTLSECACRGVASLAVVEDLQVLEDRVVQLDARSVRGHGKVPAGGQVEVPAGGQIKVPTPCSSCRSGTVGPGGDGEGANHSSPPPGSSIEVCEGPYGHHFCLSTSRVVPRGRRAGAALPPRPSNAS